MRTETRKLAGIATVVCGGVASMGAQAVESGLPAATAGPIALLDGAQLIETASRPSRFCRLSMHTGSDAQWSSDATANVTANISMPVFHTLPIAVPMQADTVADMKTEAVEPVVAATQADEPARKGGHPASRRRDASGAARLSFRCAEAMKKPPLSYAAPIAVPVHAVRPVETSTDERPGAMREQARLTKTALRAPTEPLAESSRSAKAQHVSQHVSYAAPIAIGIASRPGLIRASKAIGRCRAVCRFEAAIHVVRHGDAGHASGTASAGQAANRKIHPRCAIRAADKNPAFIRGTGNGVVPRCRLGFCEPATVG